MKLTKKKIKEITAWYFNYFCDEILPACKISGYRVVVMIELKKVNDRTTFTVGVDFPYRTINLYIREEGVKIYLKKDFEEIRHSLFHEAFHIMFWKYKDYAHSRFSSPASLNEMEEELADKFSIIINSLNEKKET